jgi:hypothetical protein
MRRSWLVLLGVVTALSCKEGAHPSGGRGGTAGISGTATNGGASAGSSTNGGAAAGSSPNGGVGGSGSDTGGTSSGGATGASGSGTGGGAASSGEGGESNGGIMGEGGTPSAGMSGSAGVGGVAGASMGMLVAPVFDGETGYVEIPDADVFSEPTTGELSVEAWIRPDSLDMPNRESSGYVHWMGKGVSGEHEWVSRMYQQGNSEDRENRISFYSFNLSGGLGAGSYFQDDVTVGEWIHYVGTFDDVRTTIYKNGVERDSDLLSGYDIVPENGSAPVRIGTRDRNSFFQGAIARVAFYDTLLDESQIAGHFAAAGADYDAAILAEPSLVAYYRLDETSGTVARDAKGSHHGAYQGGVALGDAPWPNR